MHIFLALFFIWAHRPTEQPVTSSAAYWQTDSAQWELQSVPSSSDLVMIGPEVILFLQRIEGLRAEQSFSAHDLPQLIFPFDKKKELQRLYLKKAQQCPGDSCQLPRENWAGGKRTFLMGASREGKSIALEEDWGYFEIIAKGQARWVWNTTPYAGEYALFVGANATRVYSFRIK